MNRRRTQKRKDTVNDGVERRRGRRRSFFLIDGNRIISGWPGRTLGAGGRSEGKKIAALRRLQRRNSVESRDIRGIRALGVLRFPEASVRPSSSARIRGAYKSRCATSSLSCNSLATLSQNSLLTLGFRYGCRRTATPELLRVVIEA